jgi:hypothetical protein
MKLVFFARIASALVLTGSPSEHARMNSTAAFQRKPLRAGRSGGFPKEAALSNVSGASSDRGSCVDISAWKRAFSGVTPWRVFSQWYQDSVLDSLFNERWLGTTSKFFVEFGFSIPNWTPHIRAGTGPNTQYLKFKKGWSGLLLDGRHENHAINLHKAFLTEQNLGTVFKNHGVPLNVDYVSIDIDSCDLQLFRSLLTSTPYRPKVVTVEYNREYTCAESRANICTTESGERYVWHGDNLYGSSLLAVSRVADENGYTLVWVAMHDAVFVKKSLLCPGSLVAFRELCAGNTGDRAPSVSRPAAEWEFKKWVKDYPGKLTP